MSDFKLRPLHRRRKGRRKRVQVLNQDELAARLGVEVTQLAERMDSLGWHYHRDSTGALWASPPEDSPEEPP